MSIPRNKFGTPYDHQVPMAVDITDQSSRITAVTDETVSFLVASTNAADSGSAAGTIVYGRLTNGGVLDSMRMGIGTLNDTSLTFTSTALTTEVAFPYEAYDHASSASRSAKLGTVVSGVLTSNGLYCVDYRTGLVVGLKADTGTSITASYAYRSTAATIVSTSGGDASAANQTLQLIQETNAATSLAVLDDWDENDRAKVNIINGQAGITGGAGTVDASTPRVTHASDDPVTTSVQLIDDAVFTDDAAFTPATSKGLMMMAQADETSPDSVDEADAGALRMTLNRRLITAAQSADDAVMETGTKPSLIGAIADETAPDSVDEGDMGYLRMTLTRFLKASMGDLLAGEDLTNNKMVVEHQYTYSAVAVVDTQVKASAGFLHTVTISCNDAAPTAGSLIIYDNTAESGTVVFNHTFTTTPFVPFSVVIDATMATGIYVGMTTTGDVNFSCSYR